MKTMAWICVLGFCIASLWSSQSAQGRPLYNKVFGTTYAEEYANVPGGTSCTICHTERNKYDLNIYGEAIENTQPKKGERDSEKIQSTLRAVEKQRSAVKGLTFGDLIKMGKAPASKHVEVDPQ